MKRALAILGICIPLAVLSAFCCGVSIPLELLLAWLVFLVRSVAGMNVEWPAVAIAGIALVLLIAVTHGLARWLYRSPAAEGRKPWRLRWTLASVFGLLFVFIAGIAMIGTIHQLGWLLTSDEPLIGASGREFARRWQSRNNLREIAIGCDRYHDKDHRLPPGGTFNRYGEPLHSWETHLLPYIEQRNIQPDMSLPWNHPENAKHFHAKLQVFENPSFRKPEDYVGQDGFAFSHYAANQHVMHGNYSVRFEDATDGTANTILMGEVGANFKPWGDPVNWRDPGLGINRSPDGFGGPPSNHGGSQFSFMDGSARFLRDDTAPEVLKALATPSGGENVPMP